MFVVLMSVPDTVAAGLKRSGTSLAPFVAHTKNPFKCRLEQNREQGFRAGSKRTLAGRGHWQNELVLRVDRFKEFCEDMRRQAPRGLPQQMLWAWQNAHAYCDSEERPAFYVRDKEAFEKLVAKEEKKKTKTES